MSVSNPSLLFRMRLGLRKFALIHRPLSWLKRVKLRVRAGVLNAIRSLSSSTSATGLPKGAFSELDLLKRQGLERQIVLLDQGSPRIPDPSVILLAKRGQHLQQPWPIFWARRKNARLVSKSLAHLNEKKEICAEACYGHGQVRFQDDPSYSYFAKADPVKLSGPWTSIVSKWCPANEPQTFAHFLLDSLPRLALLKHFPPETRIIVPGTKPRFYQDAMAMLGLTERCRWTHETDLLVEDYYFSSPVSMIVCHSPYTVEYLRSTFLPLVKTGGLPERFFIRRTSYGRNMVNEEETLQFFRDLNFEIVDLATMSFADQIRLFAGAKAIAAIHGSATANAVFCSPQAKLLELFADKHPAGDQEWIAQCVPFHYDFLVFPSDHKIDAYVDLPQVKSRLQAMGMI